MRKVLLIAVAVATFLSLEVLAQDAKAVIDAAAKAMGLTTLESIQ